jgi:integrase/recombinase XerD
VKSFFASLARRGLLLRSPAADLVIPSASPLPRVALSEAQATRLMEAPPQETSTGKRDHAILETLYGMGLRRGECARLDVADVDLAAGTLLVRDGKGRKDRFLPVPGRAAAALGVYLKDVRPRLVRNPHEPALFLTAWWGKRLSDVSLSFLLRRHAAAAGIVRVHPHALRHACTTHLLKGGADVRHVQVILGHKKLETTALYTRVVVEDLREVLEHAHPRERGKRARG